MLGGHVDHEGQGVANTDWPIHPRPVRTQTLTYLHLTLWRSQRKLPQVTRLDTEGRVRLA